MITVNVNVRHSYRGISIMLRWFQNYLSQPEDLTTFRKLIFLAFKPVVGSVSLKHILCVRNMLQGVQNIRCYMKRHDFSQALHWFLKHGKAMTI